jgi:two-component system, chemotaxis family, protein-glutamate methylesterase/glutaminase
MFADRLDKSIALTVTEVVDREPLLPGRIYVAPGDYHVEVRRSGESVVLRTHQSPREEDNRPSATVLFRSVAQVFGARALAVVLTGMGSDGLLGCQSVRDLGGRVLVQDQESSVVWGMPGSVVRAGLADEVLDPEALGLRLAKEAA